MTMARVHLVDPAVTRWYRFCAKSENSGRVQQSGTIRSFPEVFGTDSREVGPLSRQRRTLICMSFTLLERSEDRGCEAHERDASELRADESFGPGYGLADRRERADVIDPDGVEQHGDLMSGMGEIGENAPSEANFDETMSIMEALSSSKLAPRLRNQ